MCSQIAERVLTYGDVGTPAAELRGEFGALQGCFGEVPEGSWWHGGAKNCKVTGTFGEKESTAAFKVRCRPRRPALMFRRVCADLPNGADGLATCISEA